MGTYYTYLCIVTPVVLFVLLPRKKIIKTTLLFFNQLTEFLANRSFLLTGFRLFLQGIRRAKTETYFYQLLLKQKQLYFLMFTRVSIRVYNKKYLIILFQRLSFIVKHIVPTVIIVHRRSQHSTRIYICNVYIHHVCFI